MCYNDYMNETQKAIQALQAEGWTVKAIADVLHVSPVTISRWKSGDREPTFDTLIARTLRELLPKEVAIRG
jgi:uncharacterized protein YjcR